jgi:hypothetical protein
MKRMRRPGKGAFAIAVCGLLVSRRFGWAQDGEFAVALAQAKKAADTEPLKSYLSGPFNQVFGPRYIEWINECTTKTTTSPDDLVEILVTVGAKGTVEAVRYEPHSVATDCFIDLLKAQTFAAPPLPQVIVPAVIRWPK